MIKNYAKNMTRDDIVKFVKNNGFSVTDKEIDVIYEHIKKYYNVFFDNPFGYVKLLNGKISDENYYQILTLLDNYKHFLR